MVTGHFLVVSLFFTLKLFYTKRMARTFLYADNDNFITQVHNRRGFVSQTGSNKLLLELGDSRFARNFLRDI